MFIERLNLFNETVRFCGEEEAHSQPYGGGMTKNALPQKILRNTQESSNEEPRRSPRHSPGQKTELAGNGQTTARRSTWPVVFQIMR